MGFKPALFPSARKVVKSDVAISIHRSCQTRVKFRIRGEVRKKMGIGPGDLLTPMVDMKNRQVMLIVNSDRPTGAEKRLFRRGKGLEVEFPRKDEFAELFQGIGLGPAKVIEHGLHRLVIAGGVVLKETGS